MCSRARSCTSPFFDQRIKISFASEKSLDYCILLENSKSSHFKSGKGILRDYVIHRASLQGPLKKPTSELTEWHGDNEKRRHTFPWISFCTFWNLSHMQFKNTCCFINSVQITEGIQRNPSISEEKTEAKDVDSSSRSHRGTVKRLGPELRSPVEASRAPPSPQCQVLKHKGHLINKALL